MSRVLASWTAFWFTRRPSSTLTLFRICLGFTVFVWAISVTPDLFAFYATDGVEPNVFYGTRFTLFRWWHTDTAIVVTWAMLLVSSVAVMSGRFLRIAGPLMWVALATFQGHNRTIGNSGDGLLRLWALFYGMFALTTPQREIGARPDRTEWNAAPTWVLRLAQLQLPLIYLISMTSKLEGNLWIDGTAVPYVLRLTDFARFPLPDFLMESLVMGRILTWSTLALELALVVLLWIPRTRRLGIILGLGLHIGFDYTMRLGFFGWAMAIGYTAFFSQREAAWIINVARRLVGKAPIQLPDTGADAEADRLPAEDSAGSDGDRGPMPNESGDLLDGHGTAEEEALPEPSSHGS